MTKREEKVKRASVLRDITYLLEWLDTKKLERVRWYITKIM